MTRKQILIENGIHMKVDLSKKERMFTKGQSSYKCHNQKMVTISEIENVFGTIKHREMW